MKIIILSGATYRAIADIAILPLHPAGKQQDDGTWMVPIEDEVYQRLQQVRLPGESDDDLMTRMIRAYSGIKLH